MLVSVDKLLQGMLTIMSSDDATVLFDKLTTLIGRAWCTALKLYPSTPEMFKIVSKFLEGKTVPEFAFKYSHDLA